jgi:hypothetical protein
MPLFLLGLLLILKCNLLYSDSMPLYTRLKNWSRPYAP